MDLLKETRPRIKGSMRRAYEWLTEKSSRVLVIGDLHCPFDLDGYLEHCKDIYSRHNCNRVVFIGDIIDNHFSSYHETDPDGFGGGEPGLPGAPALRKVTELRLQRVQLFGHGAVASTAAAAALALRLWWLTHNAACSLEPGRGFVQQAGAAIIR